MHYYFSTVVRVEFVMTNNDLPKTYPYYNNTEFETEYTVAGRYNDKLKRDFCIFKYHHNNII